MSDAIRNPDDYVSVYTRDVQLDPATRASSSSTSCTRPAPASTASART